MVKKSSDMELGIALTIVFVMVAQKFIKENLDLLITLGKAIATILSLTLLGVIIYFYVTNEIFNKIVKITLKYSFHILLFLNLAISFYLIKKGFNEITILSIAIGISFTLYLLNKIKQFIFYKVSLKRAEKERFNENKERIKRLLDFNLENKTIQAIKNHLKSLDKTKFYNKVYEFYETEINLHIKQVKKILKEKLHECKLNELKVEENQILERIRTAEELERQIKLTEEERIKQKRNKFLEQCENNIYFYLNHLTKQERLWLEKIGFVKSQQWDLIQQNLKEIMIKPRSNESISHAFVTANIAKYLENKVKSVELYQTKMPDIVFKVKNRKWAIEVETGTMLKKKPKEFRKKIEMLNNMFRKNWFIVVTNKKLVQKYRKYGTVFERSKVIDYIDDLVSFSSP